RTPDVRGIAMGASDNLPGADARNGRSKNTPPLHFSEAHVGRDFALERFRMLLTREVGITELPTRAESFHCAIANGEQFRIGTESGRGRVNQQLARGRASPANRRD